MIGTFGMVERAKRGDLDPYTRAILHSTFVKDGRMSELEYRAKIEGRWSCATGSAATELALSYYRSGNVGRALDLLNLAALDGDVDAWRYLGDMWERGTGVSQSHEIACHHYQLAAEMGDLFSAWRLGLAYGSGLGIEHDPCMAYWWLLIASRSGDERIIQARDLVLPSLRPEQAARIQATAQQWKATPRQARTRH